ncbi:MAG TPA: hypothetical protein VIX15_16180 [Streptosporangiaceae bacterium]
MPRSGLWTEYEAAIDIPDLDDRARLIEDAVRVLARGPGRS